MNRLSYRLAKWLFPSQPREVRQRSLSILFAVLLVSLIVTGGIVLAILVATNFSFQFIP